jgi:hypothetical protein
MLQDGFYTVGTAAEIPEKHANQEIGVPREQ